MSSSVDNPQVLAEATAQDVPVYKRKGKAKSTVAPDSGSDSGTGSGIGPADGEVFSSCPRWTEEEKVFALSRIFEGIGVTNFRFETEEIDVPHRTTSALENFDFDFRKSAHESAAVRGMLASLLDSCDMIELPTSVLAQAAGADGPFENKKLKAAAVKLDNKDAAQKKPK